MGGSASSSARAVGPEVVPAPLTPAKASPAPAAPAPPPWSLETATPAQVGFWLRAQPLPASCNARALGDVLEKRGVDGTFLVECALAREGARRLRDFVEPRGPARKGAFLSVAEL